MKRNLLNSPRLLEIKKRRQKILLKKIILRGFGLLIVFFLLVYISRIDKLNIDSVEIVNDGVTDTELVNAIVDEELAQKYLWLFPKTNLLFYPKKSIEAKLYESFKRLKEIKFLIVDNKILRISLEERTAEYTWCGDIPDPEGEFADGSQCYFLDNSGYVFDGAPYFSGDVYFRFYGSVDGGGSDAPVGKYFSGANFAGVVSFIQMLKNIDMKPTALYLVNAEEAKIYLSSAKSSVFGPEILFKTGSDFERLAENLQSALSVDPLRSDFKKKYSSLLYIDLRFGNKVYYKFQ